MAQRSDFQLKWQPRPKGGGKQRKQKAEDASHEHESARWLQNIQ